MKQYSFLTESAKISWEEASRDPFIERLSEISGVIHEDYYTESDWDKLALSLKREALSDATTDTKSRELQLEAIFKCYWSGIPRLVALAKEFGEYEFKFHYDDHCLKYPEETRDSIRIGYMTKLANAIELYCLKKHPFHNLSKIWDEDSGSFKTEKCFYRYKVGEPVTVTWRSIDKLNDPKDRFGVIVSRHSETGRFDPRPHAVYTVKLNKSGETVDVYDEGIENKDKYK